VEAGVPGTGNIDRLDRDPRYRFKYFDKEMLRALGRLTLNGSYLESTVSVMLCRLVDHGNLDLGRRITADANFRWLIDHVRALSEYRLPEDLHTQVAAWLDRCERAYSRRSRIVHSSHGLNVTDGSKISLVWHRTSARPREFLEEVVPGTAEEVHELAQELEAAGLQGVNLMGTVQDVLGRPERTV
jgi:hypothetical protein